MLLVVMMHTGTFKVNDKWLFVSDMYIQEMIHF